jgi:redox-sensitive bicupin YhaK (pirin superfamily)
VGEVRIPQATVATQIIGEGTMEVAGLRGGHPWMDPFLTIDHFVMREPSIRPHPHAGFSAVTVMFEDSPGSFTNRDSLGTVTTIEPGGVHWTQAGSGIVHEEVPSRPPAAGHGAQIFVDLPSALEESPPNLHHLEPSQVPVVDLAGGQVRVITGGFGGVESPLRPDRDVALLDVTLLPGSSITVPAPADRSAFVLAIRGNGRVGPAGEEEALPPDHAVGFADGDGNVVRIVAGDDGLQFLFGGGSPLRQPTHWVGGVAMSTPERAVAAARRFQAGEMGHLDPSF